MSSPVRSVGLPSRAKAARERSHSTVTAFEDLVCRYDSSWGFDSRRPVLCAMTLSESVIDKKLRSLAPAFQATVG